MAGIIDWCRDKMGNASKKLAEKCTLLSKDEQPIVANSFRFASKNSDKIREDDLVKLWGSQMDPRLTQFLCNFLFGYGANKKNIVEFQRFAELYVFCVRGTIDERVTALYNSLGSDVDENIELCYQLIKEFCESIASTYMKMQKLGGCAGGQYTAWVSKGFLVQKESVQALGEGLSADLCTQTSSVNINYSTIVSWLQSNVLLSRMTEQVFRHLYQVNKGTKQSSEEELPMTSLLPMPVGLTYMPDYPAFIDLSQLLFICGHLPQDMQKEWRFLFSSNIHGESFSTLLGRIMNQGPSVIIIEDSNGYIFGGYAPSSWTLSPNFCGDDTSFLFTLVPKMRIFPSTCYNDHYQYLNMHQQTMPNGLMMGGQFEYCGLWLDSAYGDGHSSESCTTYRRYNRLSKEKDFKIKSLEVWAVGEKPPSPEELGERTNTTSILDGNSESKAILKMAGREQHSEGLREPTPT